MYAAIATGLNDLGSDSTLEVVHPQSVTAFRLAAVGSGIAEAFDERLADELEWDDAYREKVEAILKARRRKRRCSGCVRVIPLPDLFCQTCADKIDRMFRETADDEDGL